MTTFKRSIAYVSIAALLLQLGGTNITNASHSALEHVTASGILAQDITKSTATICYSLSAAGYAKVYYGQTILFGSSYHEEYASACGKIIRLTGLAANTIYYYKIVSWPSQGTEHNHGVQSADYAFRTLAADTIAPGNVADGKANLGSAAAFSSTSDSVTFNWKVPGDDGWGAGPGPALYSIRYQKRGGTLFQGPHDGGFWYSAQELSATSSRVVFTPSLDSAQMGATQTLTLVGLEAGTQYRFGVLSIDAAGNQSSLPGIWDIDTAPAPAPTDTFAPAAITGLTASSTTANSISIWWLAPWDPGINSVPQPAYRYEIRYQTPDISTEAQWQTAASAPTTPTPRPGGQTEFYTIQSLAPSTPYHIAIRAFDRAGNVSSIVSLASSTSAVPPVDTTPPQVLTPRVSYLTKNSAEINFSLDEAATVHVEYSASGGITLSTPDVSITGTGAAINTVFLTNLNPSTVYHYQIIARNAVQLTGRSPLTPFYTLSDTATSTPPSVPPSPPPSRAPEITHFRIIDIYSEYVKIEAAADQTGFMRLEYGTSSQYGNFTPWSPITVPSYITSPLSYATSTYSALKVTGLIPDTIYYGRLHVKNTSDIPASTTPTTSWKTLSLLTPPLPPGPVQPPSEPLAIYNVSPGASTMDGAGISIGWTTNRPSTSRVEYGITAALLQSVYDAGFAMNHTVSLNALDPTMQYYFRVISTDAHGSTIASSQYTFKTSRGLDQYPFGINSQALYPSSGEFNVPPIKLQLHIEFSRPIDTSTLTSTALDIRAFGSARALPGALRSFANGFDYTLFEPLVPNTAYNIAIRGFIKDTTGNQLGNDYVYAFTTGSGEIIPVGTLKVSIKDSAGTAVPAAYISLSNSSNTFNQSEQATAFGEYTFLNLKPDQYQLSVYPPKTHPGLTPLKSIALDIPAYATKEYTAVLLASLFMIKGSVLFRDKTPVSDAQVVAYRKDGQGSSWAEVNAHGEYCMVVSPGMWVLSVQPRSTYITQERQTYRESSSYACPPSVYTVAQKQILKTAQFSGSPVQTQAPQSLYSPTGIGIPSHIPFHGNWYWKEMPQEVVLGDPSTPMKTINFEVTRVAVTRIAGTIARADGALLAPNSVILRLVGGVETPPISMPIASPDGKFEFAIAPGTYRIHIDVSDPSLTPPDLDPISFPEGGTKDIGVIMLTLATESIAGTVRTDDNTPVARVKIGAWKQSTQDSRFALTDEQGSYKLTVSEGDWFIGVVPTADQQYTLIDPPRLVRVTKGKQELVNFTLSLTNAIVDGTVKGKDGAVLSEFFGYVVARIKGPSPMPGAGSPIERGHFTLRLKKGDYVLSIEVPPNSPYTPAGPLELSIASGEQKTISFIMADTQQATITGKLLNENGAAVLGIPFKVFTVSPNGSWFNADVNTEDGTYTLRVTPGSWFVDYEISPNDEYEKFSLRGVRVKLLSGEEKKIDLKVRKTTALISGKTITAQGEPVPNVWVAVSTQSFAHFSEKTAKEIEYLNGAYADKDGKFEIKVRAGTYYVRSFLPPSFGLMNPEEEKVSLKGGKTAEVTLVFRPITVTLYGVTTLNGKPNWAYVWAWSDTGGYADTTSQPNGSYELKIAPFDRWHIAALSEQQREAYKSSETLIEVSGKTKISHDIDLASLQVKLPDPVSALGQADTLSVASNTQGVKLAVPANAANTDGALTLAITPEVITPSQGANRVLGFAYDLSVRSQEGRKLNSFATDVTVTIPYDPKETAKLGLTPADLSLQYWDEAKYSWQSVRNAIVNEKEHTITCSINHLTRFAVVAATKTLAPTSPKVSLAIQKKGIAFSWNLGKQKAQIRYIKLYRSSKKGVIGKVLFNNIKKTSVTDTRVKRGKQYFYTIRAVDLFGNESINTKQITAVLR